MRGDDGGESGVGPECGTDDRGDFDVASAAAGIHEDEEHHDEADASPANCSAIGGAPKIEASSAWRRPRAACAAAARQRAERLQADLQQAEREQPADGRVGDVVGYFVAGQVRDRGREERGGEDESGPRLPEESAEDVLVGCREPRSNPAAGRKQKSRQLDDRDAFCGESSEAA